MIIPRRHHNLARVQAIALMFEATAACRARGGAQEPALQALAMKEDNGGVRVVAVVEPDGHGHGRAASWYNNKCVFIYSVRKLVSLYYCCVDISF